MQPPGAENSPPEKGPPNPPLSLNCSITPKRVVTPSGSGIATPVRSGTPSRGMETPQRSGTPSGAGSPNSVQLTPPDLIPENARFIFIVPNMLGIIMGLVTYKDLNRVYI